MRLYQHWFQKLIALTAAAIAFISFSFAPVNAADEIPVQCSNQIICLQAISKNTYNTLKIVNMLPDFFTTMSTYFENLIAGDTSQVTAEMTPNFTTVGNSIINSTNKANTPAQLTKITADVLHIAPAEFNSTNGQAPNVLNTAPYVNDIAYSSMLGLPPVTNGIQPDPYAYLKNAAGLNYPHIAPKGTWRGIAVLPKYYAYYTTILAAESFGGYVLNRFLNENSGDNQMGALQPVLVSQATNADWIKAIGSEEIGKVLRQILLFQSQTYVLMTQLIQTQKEMLTAMVLGNTLQIQVNQDKESYLATRAQGLQPQG